MRCVSCNSEISPGDRFCGQCGQKNISSVSSCAECGAVLQEGDKFCGNCGRPTITVGDIKFVKIIELFNYHEIVPVRPIFNGYILYAYLNFTLAEENIFEIIYPNDYFEYIFFDYYGEGIVAVTSMFYSNKRISLDALNGRFLSNVKAAHLNSFQYPNLSDHMKPEDLIFGLLNGDIKDCLILTCIPFSIDLENLSTLAYSSIIDQFTTIPTERRPVFIEKASDHLNIKFKSENQEVFKTVSFGESIKNTELGFFIDADYTKYFELPSGKRVYL